MLRSSLSRLLFVVPIALLALTAGCQSLGGKTTTHVHESPENTSRIAELEARVAELEAALGKGATPVTASTPDQAWTR